VGVEKTFEIGVQRGEVGRAFEIEVCPARERVAGERALPALARAHEEHGRKRPEEEPKTIGLLPLDIFHTVQFCMLGSKIQGMEIDSRFESRGLRLDVVAESEDNIGVDRLTACGRQRIVPEIVLEVYPPVIVNLHPDSLVGIHAGCRPVSQVLETLQFMEEDHVIAPEHEYTGRNHRWNKRAGCHL